MSDPKLNVTVTEQEFLQHCEDYDGVCLVCLEWSTGGCEPDARGYRCGLCGSMSVYGAEEALLMGRIVIE